MAQETSTVEKMSNMSTFEILDIQSLFERINSNWVLRV